MTLPGGLRFTSSPRPKCSPYVLEAPCPTPTMGAGTQTCPVARGARPQGRRDPRRLTERTGRRAIRNLRVGEQPHRRLAMKAAAEHISLSQYVVRRLRDAP